MTERMNTYETYTPIQATEINPLGFGNLGASISYDKQLDSGELSPEVVEAAIELIERGECMHAITDTDDGCIDGRPAKEVLFVDAQNHVSTRRIVDSSEHERAKVAGGGYITGLGISLGLGRSTDAIDQDIAHVAQQLASQGVYSGAHTGAHKHGESTDCGANDKIDTILRNGVKYKSQITESVEALINEAELDIDHRALDRVFDHWQHIEGDEAYFAGSTGASRLDAIKSHLQESQDKSGDYSKPLGVNKGLGGDHKEDFIIINYRDGETFSQHEFSEQLGAQFPDITEQKRAQAFVVDVPRIVTLAKGLTADSPEEFNQALYAGVAYQLATAATLTDGSLRTFIIK